MTTRTIRKILMYVSTVAWVIWLITNIILFKLGDSPRWSTVFILFLICFTYTISDIVLAHTDDKISDLRERLDYLKSHKTQKEYNFIERSYGDGDIIMEIDSERMFKNALSNGGYIFMQHNDGTYVECWVEDEPDLMTWGDARKHCKNLNYGGYSDWSLPTKEELDEIYKNKNKIGNFEDTWYWSDTEEEDEFYACLQNFSTGNQYNFNKINNSRVRAVRRFKIK